MKNLAKRRGSSKVVEEISWLNEANRPKVKNRIEKVLKPLANDYSIRILSATEKRGKTIRELSVELDIPIATCYRKVKELLDSSLLKFETKRLTREGKRARVFKSRIRGIETSFKFDEGKLRVITTFSKD